MFSFFICCCQHAASWNENDLPLYISDVRQILRYRTSVFIQPFPWCLHIIITYNLPHLRLWNADVVTEIAEVVCQALQTSRHEKDGTWSEFTWFETTVLMDNLKWHDCEFGINKITKKTAAELREESIKKITICQ